MIWGDASGRHPFILLYSSQAPVEGPMVRVMLPLHPRGASITETSDSMNPEDRLLMVQAQER